MKHIAKPIPTINAFIGKVDMVGNKISIYCESTQRYYKPSLALRSRIVNQDLIKRKIAFIVNEVTGRAQKIIEVMPNRAEPNERVIPDTAHPIVVDMCAALNVPYDMITSGLRVRESVIAPRHFMMWVLTKKFRFTTGYVGKILGGFAHATVLHANHNVEDLLSVDYNYKRYFEDNMKALEPVFEKYLNTGMEFNTTFTAKEERLVWDCIGRIKKSPNGKYSAQDMHDLGKLLLQEFKASTP
jgi:hypothetical protein